MTDMYMSVYRLSGQIARAEKKLASLYAKADEYGLDDIKRRYVEDLDAHEVNRAWDRAMAVTMVVKAP